MKVQATLWIIILFLTVANLFVTVKSRLERNELAALEQETQQLIGKWETQDRQRPLYEFRKDKSYQIRPSRGDWILDNDLETHVWDGEMWVKMDFTEVPDDL